MELVTPSVGLIFWTAVVFVILIFMLAKLAWKPILGAIKEREESIDNALKSAEKAKAEMQSLQASNEKLLAEARVERDAILKAAKEAKESMIAEAKTKANQEAEKLIAAARATINNEKLAAITELKNQVAVMSIDIAEKILRQELTNDDKQKALVSSLIKEVELN